MAPPLTRTLISTPTKFWHFYPVLLPNPLPCLVARKGVCFSIFHHQIAAGGADVGKLSAAPISFYPKFPKPPGCVFSSIFTKNPSPGQVSWYTTATTTTTPLTPQEIKKEVGLISEKFGEALELLNDARSSAGTVYFSEDMKDAEVMVEDTLDHYKELLAKLEAEARLDVQRSIGLKMEELKAQFQMIKDSIRD